MEKIQAHGTQGDEGGVRDLIAGIRQLMTRLDMPVSFRACGIDMDFIKSIECERAKGALSDGCMADKSEKGRRGAADGNY